VCLFLECGDLSPLYSTATRSAFCERKKAAGRQAAQHESGDRSPHSKVGIAMTKVATKDKKKKKKKKTACVICSDRREFWTTQAQFWQWVRDGVVTKTHDSPLTGNFKREHEELMVLLSNTVLNLAHPNHMREALLSRRVGLARK
jgi:hypothetical protein